VADHFYGLSVGGSIGGGVSVGTSTNSTPFELRITDGTTGMTKTEVLRLLEVLADYIVTADAPA
jgi:hypothetical protein